jgi:nucleoporin SEH1
MAHHQHSEHSKSPLTLDHSDLIHDAQADFHGHRLATCSSDQRITVHEQQPSGWVLNDAWKAHDGSVLRLSWAHPQFGSLLASCGMDRVLKVWEEMDSEQKGSGRKWAERSKLTEARGPVQDVEFAPSHLGLRLASCSADGFLRIYEALDASNNAHWSLMDELDILSAESSGSLSGPSASASEMTGSSVSGGLAMSQQQQQQSRPPSLGGQSGTGNATATATMATLSGDLSKSTPYADAHFALSWSPSKFFPTSIAVSTGKEHSVKLFRLDKTHNKWAQMETLQGHSDLVTDVAWAPNLGRSFELIATASKDGHVRIYKLKEDLSNPASLVGDISSSNSGGGTTASTSLSGTKKRQTLYRAECVADLKDHEAPVWRLNWNVTVNFLLTFHAFLPKL